MPLIEIDFELWKVLTAERKSEADSYGSVIRRMAGLKEPLPSSRKAGGRPWVLKGVEFPHDTEFRLSYKRQIFPARVNNGALEFPNGRRFDSPSRAARAITKTNVNGWSIWECKLPGQSSWKRMSSLRREEVL